MRSPLMAASQQIHHISMLFTLWTPHHIIDDSLLISQSVHLRHASCVWVHMMPNIYHWSHKEHFLVLNYIKLKIRQNKSVKIHSWGHRRIFTAVSFFLIKPWIKDQNIFFISEPNAQIKKLLSGNSVELTGVHRTVWWLFFPKCEPEVHEHVQTVH